MCALTTASRDLWFKRGKVFDATRTIEQELEERWRELYGDRATIHNGLANHTAERLIGEKHINFRVCCPRRTLRITPLAHWLAHGGCGSCGCDSDECVCVYVCVCTRTCGVRNV